MDRTSQTSKSAGSDAEAGEPGMSLGPTEAEVENWAERVRLRRQAWVDGPTEEEKQEWQRRERARRAARKPSRGLATVTGSGLIRTKSASVSNGGTRARYGWRPRASGSGWPPGRSASWPI